MIKLSDAVKDYKSKKHSIYIGPGDVEYLFKMLGDVEIDEDVLAVFLDDLRINPLGSGRFGDSRNYDYAEKEFGIIFKLIDKINIPKGYVKKLLKLYYPGVYELYFDELREKCLKCGSDSEDKITLPAFSKYINKYILESEKRVLNDIKKIDELKEIYGNSFIERIKKAMVEKTVLYEDVISILPSKEFIDNSITKVPYFGYEINSAEDFVHQRLLNVISDKTYESYGKDDCIVLGAGYSEVRPLTSFTKGELEEELERVAIERKNKGNIKR